MRRSRRHGFDSLSSGIGLSPAGRFVGRIIGDAPVLKWNVFRTVASDVSGARTKSVCRESAGECGLRYDPGPHSTISP